MCEGGGGRRRRRRRHPGYRIKNKNPTQRCGEKTMTIGIGGSLFSDKPILFDQHNTRDEATNSLPFRDCAVLEFGAQALLGHV
jgi:hypothetical protein